MVTDKRADYEAMIEAKIEDKDDEALASLDETCAMEFTEHARYQDAQARAFISGRLSEADAQAAYSALGEVYNESNGGWSQGTTLARKITVTQLVGELIGAA